MKTHVRSLRWVASLALFLLTRVSLGQSQPTSPIVTLKTTYDATGNRTMLTWSADAGVSLALNYDALDKPVAVTDGAKGVTQFGYDGQGRTVFVADTRTLITEYQRDGLGNSQLVSPDTGIARKVYDAAGNVKSMTDARGAVTTVTYDASNRVTSVANALGASTRTTTFRYSETGAGFAFGVGRLTSAQTPETTATFAYDSAGRLAREMRTIEPASGANANSVRQGVRYSYTAGGAVREIGYPSGYSIAFTRTAERVTGVSLVRRAPRGVVSPPDTVIVSQVRYTPFGPIESWVWGGGPRGAITFPHPKSYDSMGRMIRYPLGDVVRDVRFDSAGRVEEYTHVDSKTGAAVPAMNQSFSSDALGELTQFSIGGEARGLYRYDANGNRLSEVVQGVSRTYVVDPTSNRLTSATNPTQLFTYDAVGNTLSDGRFVADYDEANRLKKVTVAGLSTTSTYDEQGRRVRKSSKAGTVLFAYDQQGHLLGEYDQTGLAIAEYVWLDDTPIAVIIENEVFFIHADHLDTPRVIVDRGGAVRWRWLADPFGTAAPELPAFTFNLRGPGQYADKETGLVFNHARDYDPRLGRYIESDPSGLEGGPNTYAFVFNDPLRFTDPTGLMGNGAAGLGGARLSRQITPLNPTLYYGAEAHFGVGGGLAAVTCTDKCGQRKTFRYYKICGGLAVGASFGGGAVTNMTGETCKPEMYEGWFAEGGVSSPWVGGIGIDIGFNADGRPTLPAFGLPNLPGTRSGVDEVSGGFGAFSRGVMAKGTLCFYKSL